MQFIKVRDVKSPIRNVEENAGIDFYIPENNEDFRSAFLNKNSETVMVDQNLDFALIKATDEKKNIFDMATGMVYIAPHKDVLIPSGIKSKFSNDLALIANNKSGVATKKKLVFGASVIDASYQGEWHLHVINTSDKYQAIQCGTKIIQFIPHLISTDPVEIVDMSAEDFYKDTTSSRGDKGFGNGTGIN